VTVADTEIDGTPVRVTRELLLGGGRLDPRLGLRVSVEHRGSAPLRARLGVEWALTMLGGGGNPSAWWEAGDGRSSHDGSGSRTGITALAQGNDWLGVAVETSVEPAADAWWAPIETVSNSEDGFERVYQGSALLLSWPVELAPGATWHVAIEHRATVAVDRWAVEQAPPRPAAAPTDGAPPAATPESAGAASST
jgi:hypothetical protein